MEIIKTIKQIPALRLLIPLILGIILGNLYVFGVIPIFLTLLSLLIISLIFGFTLTFMKKIMLQKYFGITVSALFLLLGVLIINLKDKNLTSEHEISTERDTYLVEVRDLPQEKTKSFQIKTRLLAVIDSQSYINAKVGVILYLSKEDNFVQEIITGNKLIINARLNEIKNRNNPNEFDYKRFINRRGYQYTAYLKSGNYEKWLGDNRNKNLNSRIAVLRLSILNRLQAEFDDQTFALLSSMLIGVKDDLDEETRNSFSASGITHLLAISGLHVGILFLVLTYSFSFLGNGLVARLSSNIIIILVLWLYAMLAGLSPSVVRATIMFSAIVVGNLLNRKSLVYNSLSFAALLMLLLNPYNLFEVGFQLSFLAVLGIVYFQPKIKNFVKTQNSIISFVWGIISVSIAAQLATFPLTIYYFHQFPNYFIIGNLLTIPLFFINLILGLVYIVLGWIPYVGTILQFLTETLSKLILKISYFVSDLRFSVTDGLVLNQLQVVFIYLALILIAFYLSFRRGRYFISVQVCFLFVLLVSIHQTFPKNTNKEFTIYNNQNTLISYIDGFHSYCFIDSSDLENDKYEYSLKEHLIKQQAFKKRELLPIDKNYQNKQFCIQTLEKGNNLVVFGEEKFFLLNEFPPSCGDKITVDYVVLNNNVQIPIQTLQEKYDFKKIIITSSNSNWKISSWIAECKELGLDYFSISESGAFQLGI